MSYFVSFFLLLASSCDVVMIFSLFKSFFEVKNSQKEALFLVCLGNIISNMAYGIMLLTGGSVRYLLLSRFIAVFGISVFFISLQILLFSFAQIHEYLKVAILTFEISVVIVFLFYLFTASKVDFYIAPFGITYKYDSDRVWELVSVVKMLFAIGAGLIEYLFLGKAKNKRDKKISAGLTVVTVSLFVESLIEYARNGDDIVFFPYSTILYFLCCTGMYIAFKRIEANTINFRNLSDYFFLNMESPILVFDDERRLKLINNFGCEYFNMHEDECMHMPVSTFFNVNEEIFNTKDKNNILDCICVKNNANCSLSVNRMTDNYMELLGYVVFVIDQTERVKALEQANRSREQAELANRAKSDFLANMSHEIRTPINTIIGMDEMILRQTTEKELIRYASDIKNAGMSLLSIISDILDFSKIESGKMVLSPSTYDIDSLLAEEINAMSFKAKEKGIRFFYDIDPKLPKKLYGDDVRVRQILTNLLSNAIKYTAKGRIMFTVKGHEINEDEIDVQVAVTDTGIGIKKEDMPGLFQAFTRLDITKNRAIEGTGLGLNITNRILKMMNGSLDVKSTYGKGSTFSCTFRQHIEDHEFIGDFDIYYENYVGVSYKHHKKFEAPNASVLVVDDNNMNIVVAKSLLEETKINVTAVQSGEEAVKSAHENLYDIIFMDHMMPGMDGVEALSRIKDDKIGLSHETPIIVMTANAVAGAKQMYLSKGFSDYISKPIEPAVLEGVILKHLPEDKIQYINTRVSDWIEEDKDNADELEVIKNKLEANGINAVAGLRKMNNNIELYQQNIRLFLKSAEEKRKILKIYLDGNEDKNFSIEAHSLKSSAMILGAEKLANICYQLEMAGKEYRLEAAQKNWEAFSKEFSEISRIFSEYISSVEYEDEIDSVTGKKEITEDELKEKLDNIKELVEEYEHRDAKHEIELLMDYILSEDILNKLKALYKALDTLDYESGMKICEEL